MYFMLCTILKSNKNILSKNMVRDKLIKVTIFIRHSSIYLQYITQNIITQLNNLKMNATVFFERHMWLVIIQTTAIHENMVIFGGYVLQLVSPQTDFSTLENLT